MITLGFIVATQPFSLMSPCCLWNSQGKNSDWPGLLSPDANLILHQHSVQGDITPLQEALCYWLAFSRKYREQRFDSTCLWNILKTLDEKWAEGQLSGEEVCWLSVAPLRLFENLNRFSSWKPLRNVERKMFSSILHITLLCRPFRKPD